MRKILLFALLFCGTNLFAQSPLAIKQLTGDYYVYTTYNSYAGTLYPSNSLYVVTNNGVVMIDTPWDTTQFQPLLDSIKARHNKEVVLCISTHFHEDRTGGVDFLKAKGIQTFASHKTVEFCRSRNERTPANSFKKDTTFQVGQHTFNTFYPGPGHTEDNIVVWFPDAKVLYGGCFVKSTDSGSLGNLADANVDAWEGSMTKTMEKFSKASFVIPGHEGWESTKSLQHTLQMIQEKKKSGK